MIEERYEKITTYKISKDFGHCHFIQMRTQKEDAEKLNEALEESHWLFKLLIKYKALPYQEENKYIPSIDDTGYLTSFISPFVTKEQLERMIANLCGALRKDFDTLNLAMQDLCLEEDKSLLKERKDVLFEDYKKLLEVIKKRNIVFW